MSESEDRSEDSGHARADEAVRRILSRHGTAITGRGDEQDGEDEIRHAREDRAALTRLPGISTEIEDVSEVEYRALRLEKVVLAGQWSHGTREEAEVSMRELAALAQTAGSVVLDAMIQHRPHPDPAAYFGSGKARELAGIVAAAGADTVIVNGDLAPSQRRALEDIVKVKVVDRTAVILDIFAQHAKSKEGKAEVELAQLEYLLPRLRGWGESMSRQAGGRVAGGEGIGSRGPGETKIELDRRRIRSRMAHLRRQIKAMAPAREVRREKRETVPNVAIVGYTNAGKSSLLNRLTGAGVLVENVLFATLDPTIRRAETSGGRVFTLSDTVGFVRDLPHQLVAAFQSTLEEVSHAELLLHVVDVAHDDPEGQIRAVREVLSEVPGASSIPEILVLNKCDVADPAVVVRLHAAGDVVVDVSALTGKGIESLMTAIEDNLPEPEELVDVVVPYTRGDLVSEAHQRGEILEEHHGPGGTRLVARVDGALAARLRESGTQPHTED